MSVRYFEARKVDSIDKKEDIRLTECMRIVFLYGIGQIVFYILDRILQ